MKRIVNSLLNVVIGVASALLISLIGVIIFIKNFSEMALDNHIRDMYQQIVVQTGQIQEALPLIITENKDVNAYNDGEYIVLYRGMIDYVENDDELALVLGHEVAHGTLRHVYFREFGKSEYEIATAEGNADKLGAIYMMKAGWDVCIGREIWQRMRTEEGNYIGGDHPTASYRFDELNIGCE